MRFSFNILLWILKKNLNLVDFLKLNMIMKTFNNSTYSTEFSHTPPIGDIITNPKEKIPSRIICKGAPNKSPEAIDALLMHSYTVCFTRFSKPFTPRLRDSANFLRWYSPRGSRRRIRSNLLNILCFRT